MEETEAKVIGVQHIQLVNGEEIFGNVVETPDGIFINDPLKTTEIETEDGSVFSLVHYLPYSEDNTCFISYDKIVTHNSVNMEMCKFYMLSAYFAERMAEERNEEMIKTNLRMSNLIMDETASKKSKTGNLIIPSVNVIH